MIYIFTTLKAGQALMPEVLEGVAKQDVHVALIPIVSKGGKSHSESNKLKNVLDALEINTNDYFILMDSDVVLGSPSIVREMLDDKLNMERKIVAVTTKGERIEQCGYIPHALMLVRDHMVGTFYEYLKNYQLTGEEKEHCFVCRFVQHYVNDCISLQNQNIREVYRVDLCN